jgi:nucleotide-binding universal stress UspA family protein
MSKRILVPIDGSKSSEEAIASLGAFASAGDTLVLLKVERPDHQTRDGFTPGRIVHSAIIGGSGGGGGGVANPDLPHFAETHDQSLQRQVDEARDYLEDLAKAPRKQGFQVDTEVLISEKPAEAITDYARRIDAGVIAMLPRTHRTLRETLLGSISTDVMKAGVAPVLFLPAKE